MPAGESQLLYWRCSKDQLYVIEAVGLLCKWCVVLPACHDTLVFILLRWNLTELDNLLLINFTDIDVGSHGVMQVGRFAVGVFTIIELCCRRILEA